MNERRPVGALEHAVLDCLWSATGAEGAETGRFAEGAETGRFAEGAEPGRVALTPREVLDRLGTDLAYTTVVTILTRLSAKGMVEREKDGRVFRYRATRSQADVLAARMQAALADAGDREATLSRFAEGLSGREADALRSLLDDLQPGDGAAGPDR